MSPDPGHGRDLAGLGLGGPVFTGWLESGRAASEVSEALGDAPGPAAGGGDWLARALHSGDDRGPVRCIVTGQQPGFLGGPLLTLFKVATAIELARARTTAGRPTKAVFWCGDDDEDLVEALAPIGWDPILLDVQAEGRLAARNGQAARRLVGPTPARRWCAPGAAMLARLAARRPGEVLPRDLADLWRRALDEDWDWSRLNVAAVERVFAGQPLVVVRGNDPELHAAAAPFYGIVERRRGACVELVRARGRELADGAGQAPISERSLRNHLFVVEGERRRPLAMGEALPDAAQLRPGVLLRSPLQDWLFDPVAVVVGPGEYSYLDQLRPAYVELGVRRGPLVPRLFGWALEPSTPTAELLALDPAPRLDRAGAAALAEGLAARAAQELATALTAALGVPPARAGELAGGRARRWRRGVTALMADEARRRWLEQGETFPGWLVPEGRRQERGLAAMAAVGLLGDAFVPALLAAAAAHLESGARGRWREYLVR